MYVAFNAPAFSATVLEIVSNEDPRNKRAVADKRNQCMGFIRKPFLVSEKDSLRIRDHIIDARVPQHNARGRMDDYGRGSRDFEMAWRE